MPSYYFVACDWTNRKLKLLDSSSILIESLTLLCGPWDITAVDTDDVIVAFPINMQLQ